MKNTYSMRFLLLDKNKKSVKHNCLTPYDLALHAIKSDLEICVKVSDLSDTIFKKAHLEQLIKEKDGVWSKQST